MLDAFGKTPDPIATAAVHILEQPESYPGLRALNLGETVFRLIVAPSQTWYPVSLWLLQLTASSALVRRVEWDRNLDRRFPQAAPHTFGADAEIPRDQADALVEELGRISICPFQPISMGIDGVIQTVEFWDGGIRTASVSWWEGSGERPELFAWLSVPALSSRHTSPSAPRGTHKSRTPSPTRIALWASSASTDSQVDSPAGTCVLSREGG